ncbi:GNAT family N-acetyltransferase [Qipengyuania sp.]|uniref:GNAT family N-acetyltransferase n=1 Tax=Qipengyuania sp. TaxID=2004515 RepID=UPI0035C78DE6
MAADIRPATSADLPALAALIERAYRGDTARLGWTHEADLLFDTRLSEGELEEILHDPDQTQLVMLEGGTLLGCVNVARRSSNLAYLGLLCIEPTRQGEGLGRGLIAAAETHAHDAFGCSAIEMTVIEQRSELIAYYQRRGWQVTGEQRDFPVALDPPLYMTVLAKPLA